MDLRLTIVLFLFAFISCTKETESIIEESPTEVSFNYSGEEVTYGVVKKIYTVDSNGDVLSNTIQKLWLDRNLGADRIGEAKNDELAAGDLFQWGRQADGHEKRSSDTIQMHSETIVPPHGLYLAHLFGNDWLLESNDSLWNDVNNTNCPCPEEWRVPSIEELSMEMHSWESLNLDAAFSSDLKWVTGGNRDNHGTERYSDIWAFVHSSTISSNGRVENLAIIGNDTSETIESPRGYASSVRCIKNP